jgi:hypothetical protein
MDDGDGARRSDAQMWKAIETKLDTWKKNWKSVGGQLTSDGGQQVYLCDWLNDKELGGFLTCQNP